MKNLAIIAVTSAITLAGAITIYLSQTIFKYNNIKNNFPYTNATMEAYPYTNTDTPDDFKDFNVKGISFKAPDDLTSKYPDAESGLQEGILINGSSDSDDLTVLVTDLTAPTMPKYYGNDFFNSSMKRGMDKMGYKVPENLYELSVLLGTIDLKDCDKFSPSQVNSFYKLAVLRDTMKPSILGYGDTDVVYTSTHKYYHTADKCSCIFTEQKNDSGNYKLEITLYNNADPNHYQEILIIGKDSRTIQQIANTLTVSE